MNSRGLGPTTRWMRSMLFSSGGIALVKAPKLLAKDCKKHSQVTQVSEQRCEMTATRKAQ